MRSFAKLLKFSLACLVRPSSPLLFDWVGTDAQFDWFGYFTFRQTGINMESLILVQVHCALQYKVFTQMFTVYVY